MGKVIKISITKESKGVMESLESVTAIEGKGIVKDRHFKDNNDKKCQITLIEIESIRYYNKVTGVLIPSIDFRRNIITEGVELNKLVGKDFFVGEVKIKAHDLCRPCKYLQETFKQKNVIKELMLKGGLRCEILKSGKISVNDQLKI